MSIPTDPHGISARAAKVIAELSRTPGRVTDVFEDLSHWERIWRPTPETWNCAEIAGHLLDAEIAYGYRLRMALAEPGAALSLFEQNAWVASQGYSDIPAEETLMTFAALRRNLALFAGRLSESELERHYNLETRGHQTIWDGLVFLQSHDARHLVQLGRISELARQARAL